jgi:pimeloyl-ACP methyl ester carboxylesterase
LWRNVLPSLKERMRVIAPDLSAGDRALGAQAARVRGLLDHLGIEEIAAVGHGAGGVVAGLLALEGGVLCLVLIDAGPFAPGEQRALGGAPDPEAWAGLDIPALVIWGEEDPYLPASEAERLADALPHSTLVLLPGCGHFLPEEAPDAVAPLMAEFLRARYLRLPHAHEHAGGEGPVPIELHRTRGSRGPA